MPFPYLVLMKFQAGRVQDLADVTRMLGQASHEMLETLRQLFVEFLPADLDDFESLVQLGRMEFESPNRIPKAGDNNSRGKRG